MLICGLYLGLFNKWIAFTVNPSEWAKLNFQLNKTKINQKDKVRHVDGYIGDISSKSTWWDSSQINIEYTQSERVGEGRPLAGREQGGGRETADGTWSTCQRGKTNDDSCESNEMSAR